MSKNKEDGRSGSGYDYLMGLLEASAADYPGEVCDWIEGIVKN